MTADLLQCVICPKLPCFTDISHLLTHAGSKGHLAHHHKLQIRSHQDDVACQQLAAYEKWFKAHDIAKLLSERLQQKEAKQVPRKTGSKCRTKLETASRPSLPVVTSMPSPVGALAVHDPSLCDLYQDYKLTHYEGHPEDVYTPVRRSSRTRPQILASSPYKCEEYEAEDDLTPSSDLRLNMTPGTPLLKGTIWPGMWLFDAADEETKRKRNQRKNGSVLKRMEQASTQVKPYETVHSANGKALKERHLDDMENDSLVEGESPLMRPSPKRKSRRSPKLSRGQQGRRTKRKLGGRQQRSPLTTRIRTANSSHVNIRTPNKMQLHSKVDGSGALDAAFKHEGVNIKRDFTVFQDHKPELAYEVHTERLPNPFLEAASNSFPYSLPRPALRELPQWQPRNHPPPASNSFREFAASHEVKHLHDRVDMYKTEISSALEPTNSRLDTNNNLLVRDTDLERSSTLLYASMADLIHLPCSPLRTPFGDQLQQLQDQSRNPLFGAFGHLDSFAGFGE